MITLYGVTRSRALRCLWMLEELGIPYTQVPTNFATGDTRTAEFLRINPNGHVPALVDGDVTLCESLAINLYLARRYGQALWPTNVGDEGRVYQWSLWAMTELEEPLITCLFQRVILPEAQRDAQKAADAETRAGKPLRVLDAALADRPYLLGDTFSVADVNVAGVGSWIKLARLDMSALPHVAAWLERCLGRPAFDRAVKK